MAKAADRALAALGAERAFALGLGDEDVGDVTGPFKRWAKQVQPCVRVCLGGGGGQTRASQRAPAVVAAGAPCGSPSVKP